MLQSSHSPQVPEDDWQFSCAQWPVLARWCNHTHFHEEIYPFLLLPRFDCPTSWPFGLLVFLSNNLSLSTSFLSTSRHLLQCSSPTGAGDASEGPSEPPSPRPEFSQGYSNVPSPGKGSSSGAGNHTWAPDSDLSPRGPEPVQSAPSSVSILDTSSQDSQSSGNTWDNHFSIPPRWFNWYKLNSSLWIARREWITFIELMVGRCRTNLFLSSPSWGCGHLSSCSVQLMTGTP